jgi:hypothetical protein
MFAICSLLTPSCRSVTLFAVHTRNGQLFTSFQRRTFSATHWATRAAGPVSFKKKHRTMAMATP